MSEIPERETPEQAGTGMPDELRERLHLREAVCAELEALPGNGRCSDCEGEISRLTEKYNSMPEIPPEYGELIDKRFAQAAERFRNSCALDTEVQRLVDAGELVTLHEIEALEKKFLSFHAGSELRAAEIAALFGAVKNSLTAEAAESDRLRSESDRLTEELKELTAGENIEALKERKAAIDAEYAALGAVPQDAARRFTDASRRASAKLSRHYETLDFARWESYTLKLDICSELEKLSIVPEKELSNASRRLHELRERWKTLGSVPKEKNDEINPRYLELTRSLQRRVDEFFAARRQEQKAAVAAKEELIAEAEKLANSTNWGITSGAFRDLQAKWKEIPRAGAAENALFTRFRAAAGTFFDARNAHFAERDRKFQESVAAKKALIAEAETMTDPRRARSLREEFRRLPSAGRKEHELFLALDAALEKFFAARRESFAGKEKESRELIAEVEQLAAAPGASLSRIREIRRRLDELNTRSTAAAEKSAFAAFDRALSAERAKETGEKYLIYREVVTLLAERYDSWKAAGEVPETPVDGVEAFSRPSQFVTLLNAAAGGDAKAAEKVEKSVNAARAEYESLLSDLEALAGIGTGNDAPLSLAAELEAAIMGNFAKAEARAAEKKADPTELRQRFLNAGVVPAAEFSEFCRRFDAASGEIEKLN